MFPGVSGFQWDAGHVIFLGAFFSVVSAVAVTVVAAWFRTLRDRQPQREQAIRWHFDFSELPAPDRRCRHELTGEIAERQCQNEFDCRRCGKHREFGQSLPGPMAEVETQTVVAGVPIPLDRLYHRGHTWARQETDGSFTVGIDAFASRLLGSKAKIETPAPGSPIFANGAAFLVRTAGDCYRMLSPVSGRVTEAKPDGNEWVLNVEPEEGFRTDHLLRGCEVTAWLSKEFERVQIAMGGGAGPLLADGGALVDDPAAEYPALDWDDVRARMLLNT